jgi:asparagine synthase (glutamine-hydrolysing)
MCGIAGAIGYHEAVVERMVEDMSAALRHRGPDGSGVFTDGDFALGHRRLAILDLSDAGRQPMISRDGRFVLALNGEIFNYLELRRQLGGEFRSGTDTEVLLEACAEWGVRSALERTIGMFAFALWDRKERELTLARDAYGEKPLVYLEGSGKLAFASEMKALAPYCDRRLDSKAVDAYFALGHVPAPLGIFRGTRKLPAGYWLRFKNGIATVGRWKCEERLEGGVRERIRDAVALRLRADVPVALCLSGGVDSSIVAAECVALGANPQAFTVAFEGEQTDAGYARLVASKLSLEHEILQVSAPPPEHLFEHYDEPFADSSAVGALALARAIGSRFKLVLNGDGGDEAFGGYRHYEYVAAKQALKRAAAQAGIVDGQGSEVYFQSRATFRIAERRALANGNWCGNALGSMQPHAGETELHRALTADREVELANRLTYKTDIAFGSAAVEGRAPFLDHRVMDWSATAPARDLVWGREKKVALRAAYRGVLPDEVLDRPKLGFGAPVAHWVRGAWQEYVRDMLPCPLLDRDAQRRLASGHAQRLWTLATFAAWSRRWGASW